MRQPSANPRTGQRIKVVRHSEYTLPGWNKWRQSVSEVSVTWHH